MDTNRIENTEIDCRHWVDALDAWAGEIEHQLMLMGQAEEADAAFDAGEFSAGYWAQEEFLADMDLHWLAESLQQIRGQEPYFARPTYGWEIELAMKQDARDTLTCKQCGREVSRQYSWDMSDDPADLLCDECYFGDNDD